MCNYVTDAWDGEKLKMFAFIYFFFTRCGVLPSLIKRRDEERFFLPLAHRMAIFIAVQPSHVLTECTALVIPLSGHRVGIKNDEHTFGWLQAS